MAIFEINSLKKKKPALNYINSHLLIKKYEIPLEKIEKKIEKNLSSIFEFGKIKKKKWKTKISTMVIMITFWRLALT